MEEHPFPVTVHVDGDYAKEGSSCVLTVPTNASDYYAYRKPLSDENEQTISFIVPAAKYSSQITIELLDSYERVIYSRTCTYQAYDEWQNMLLAGHMGKQTDTVSWPEQIKRNDLGTAVSVRTVTLTEDNLYTEKEGYGMLDFLSVDVAYFEELSSDVKNALLDWVKEGYRAMDLCFFLIGTFLFKGFFHEVHHRNSADTSLRFGRVAVEVATLLAAVVLTVVVVDQRVVDGDRPFLKIHIAPAQPSRFSYTQACTKHHEVCIV